MCPVAVCSKTNRNASSRNNSFTQYCPRPNTGRAVAGGGAPGGGGKPGGRADGSGSGTRGSRGDNSIYPIARGGDGRALDRVRAGAQAQQRGRTWASVGQKKVKSTWLINNINASSRIVHGIIRSTYYGSALRVWIGYRAGVVVAAAAASSPTTRPEAIYIYSRLHTSSCLFMVETLERGEKHFFFKKRVQIGRHAPKRERSSWPAQALYRPIR
jgi:hypothetical protein